jgi:hypothetical protein
MQAYLKDTNASPREPVTQNINGLPGRSPCRVGDSSSRPMPGSQRLHRRVNDWFKTDEQRGAAPRSYANKKTTITPLADGCMWI